MTDLEKALEMEAEKFVKENVSEESAFTEEEKQWAIIFKSVTRTSFKSGARWAREFTVMEICKYLRKDARYILYLQAATEIESHFLGKHKYE